MKKIVAFYSYPPKIHSLYQQIIKFPPTGYNYTIDPSKVSKQLKGFYTSKEVKGLGDWILKGVDTVRIKDFLFRFKKFPEHNLLYSAGYICWRKEPWIVDMEFPSSLTGYSLERFEAGKKRLAKALASKYCKRIIPWTGAASESMRRAFPQKTIQKKIITVPLVIEAKTKCWKPRKDKKVKLFFVGSSNIPFDFLVKGGLDVLMTYEKLVKKYGNKIELTFRCYLPPEHKKRFAKLPGLKIVDKIIPFKDLEALYTGSDIFLGPAHHTPGVAHLEAMSYGLPVIATDVWENSKIVSKDVGLLIPKHNKAPYFGKYGMPLWGTRTFYEAIQEPDMKRIAAFVKQTSKLIDNPQLRQRMGRAGRKRVGTGPYSIKARNKILKKVYNEATR